MEVCLACLMMAAGPPAVATPTEQTAATADDLQGLEVVPDEELAEHRGGFTWQGVEIALGAEIRTFLDGELVLQTNISWTAAGATSQQLVSGALTPADAAQLQAGILVSGGIEMRVGDQDVFLANQGQTAILHRTDGVLQNVLVNRASNIEARQEVDAVLDLQNFAPFQQGLLETRLGRTVGDMIADATVIGLGN